MKTALCFSILMLALFANSSPAQVHQVCGLARQPAPHLFLAADAAGNLFIGDQVERTILKRTPAGVTTTFAQGLGAFNDIALDNTGNLFIAEANPPLIKKVTATGVISTFAGNGAMGIGGDNGPATAAALCTPVKVAVDSEGNLFINFGISGTDSLDGDYRIRKVAPDGVITTFAGGGRFATGPRGGPAPGTIRDIPDGGQATSRPFVTGNLAAGDNANNLFVTIRPGSGGSRVRKISPSGIITTVAGTGATAFSGDGGPATAAELGIISAIAVDAGGNLYLAEFAGRIRKVSASGIITTIAGTGVQGFGGAEGPAVSAQLANITDLALDGTGNLFIAETTGGQAQGTPPWTKRLRKITPAGVISTVYTKQ
jgi:hypothetical protein